MVTHHDIEFCAIYYNEHHEHQVNQVNQENRVNHGSDTIP